METLAILLILALLGQEQLIDYFADNVFFADDKVRSREYDIWVERDLVLTTDDKVSLVSDIYHPKGLQKTPTILIRIPLSKNFTNQIKADMICRYFSGRGYTVVLQGTRGRYKSTGSFYPLVGEEKDGLQTLEWLKNQNWYDGRLGMWGGSSFGYTQWVLADKKSDIDALSIQIASSHFKDLFYVGGAFSLESALYWAMRSSGEQDKSVDESILVKSVTTLPIVNADNAAGGDIDFFNDWVNYSPDYWKEIDGNERAKNIQVPVLLLGGWFDPFLQSQLQDYKDIVNSDNINASQETKLIIGPWAHAKSIKIPDFDLEIPYRLHAVTSSVPWFDKHLKNKSNIKISETAPVKLFVMGSNIWRDEYEWPLARTQYTSFYLHSNGTANTDKDGALLKSVPINTGAVDRYIYDPINPVPTAGGAMLSDSVGIKKQNSIEDRYDVLTYSTKPLTTDIEITGEIAVELYVSTDAPSTDFTAKLVDVYPDGTAYNLTDSIVRKTYSDTGVQKITIQLPPTSNVFYQGHRIRLEISSSNFPRFDRNSNTGKPFKHRSQGRTAQQTIYHGALTPSRVILPIIPVNKPISF